MSGSELWVRHCCVWPLPVLHTVVLGVAVHLGLRGTI